MATRFATRGVSPGAVVLAAAIPILFLHVRYQPGLGVDFGGTTVNAYLSDFAVLAIVVTALVEGARRGFAALRPGLHLWLPVAVFLLWVLVEVALGHRHSSSYPWRTHGVTAAKFAEYALIAPAVPLLLRRGRDALLPAWSLVVWSSFATTVGIAQFFGARIFFSGAAGHRQASFLSMADFAVLSGAALLVGVVCAVMGSDRRLTSAALATGALGMIVAGALAAILGLATALAALGVVVLLRRRDLPRRRLRAVAAVAGVVLLGAVAIRLGDITDFGRFLGTSSVTAQPQAKKVQTYAHRTLLAWLGFEIWKDHPVTGVGWEGSSEPASFQPYLPAAHRRFPKEAPLAFPSAAPDRRYGVQNSWIQALADLGVIGLALWAAVFAAAAWVAARALDSPTGLYGLLSVALLVWLWTAQGFVAGIPLDAFTFLAFGAGAARLQQE